MRTLLPILEPVSRPAQSLLPLTLLQERDYTVIMSRSNTVCQVPGLAKSWRQAENVIQLLSQACASLDADGITVHVADPTLETGFSFQTYGELMGSGLSRILLESYPPSRCDYVAIVEEAIADYFQRKAEGKTQPNGEVFLCFLDGESVDSRRLIQLIVQTTQLMEHEFELAIGLIQIGEDPLAQGFFQALDHDLHRAGAVYDIVHSQQITKVNLENPYSFLWDILTK